MVKRTVFTNITPLPPSVSREVAIAMLQNHDEMIELNPLVIEHHAITTPRDAPADEFLDCSWQELTDKIHYLPGGLVKGKVSYRACFHNLANGLQTHIYAPLGLDIREKWTICGSLPGEPEEPRELGLNTPRRGLYLKEEGDMRCNMLMTSFVRKNLDNSHKTLVERILGKASRVQAHVSANFNSPQTPARQDTMDSLRSPTFQPGSHMSKSAFTRSPSLGAATSPPLPAQQPMRSGSSAEHIHPALRDQYTQQQNNSDAPPNDVPPSYEARNPQHEQYYRQDMVKKPSGKEFAAEMEGSTTHYATASASSSSVPSTQRQFNASELDGSEVHSTFRSNTSASQSSRPMIPEMPSDQTQNPGSTSQPIRDSFESGDDGARPLPQVAPLRPRKDEAGRYSMVSEVSDMPTPKPNQQGFGDNRFSVVSAMTEGAPTPRPEQTSFAVQQAQDQHRQNMF